MIDKNELKKLIDNSGYPFELEVIKIMQKHKFTVQPSYLFFDKSRDKDVELDVIAIKRQQFSSKRIGDLLGILNIAIECKKNTYPYVLFGTKNNYEPIDGYIDDEYRYLHMMTSRDKGIKNLFSLVQLERNKIELHPFNSNLRHYSATEVEPKGNNYKLHQSEKIIYAIQKLGAYTGNYTDNAKDKKFLNVLEDMDHKPVIFINFNLLVHHGIHYRINDELNNPIESGFTSLFSNRTYDESTISFIVDFVQFKELDMAITKIQRTFELMVSNTIRFFEKK